MTSFSVVAPDLATAPSDFSWIVVRPAARLIGKRASGFQADIVGESILRGAIRIAGGKAKLLRFPAGAILEWLAHR